MKRSDVLKLFGEINNTKNYLEIGVEAGVTINDLNFDKKTAVDKKFLFDYQNTQSTTYYEIDSDSFFRKAISSHEKYDLIFIDGYHLFEYALRDFLNSTLVAHKGTIIIIDDVIPSDYLSQLRSQALCNKLKESSLVINRNWMGDVFKIIPIINQIFTQWSYKTTTINHGMTILWNQAREPETTELFLPTYDDVIFNKIPYNFADLDEIQRNLLIFFNEQNILTSS